LSPRQTLLAGARGGTGEFAIRQNFCVHPTAKEARAKERKKHRGRDRTRGVPAISLIRKSQKKNSEKLELYAGERDGSFWQLRTREIKVHSALTPLWHQGGEKWSRSAGEGGVRLGGGEKARWKRAEVEL